MRSKTIKYLERLIRTDFDNCEDSLLGDHKKHEIIQHAKILNLSNDFITEMINDYCESNLMQNTRLELLEQIQNNNSIN